MFALMEEETLTTACYRRIYEDYAPMLLRFAQKYVSFVCAEDLVHDVFLKLWDKQLYLLPDAELKRLLYAAVRNACIDYLRREALEQEVLDKKALQLRLDELDYFASSDELFMREDLFQFLLQKIDELPDRSREVFLLAYVEGLKAAEIAEQLGISVRTVENLLYRSLLHLRERCSNLFIYFFILMLN